jgi:hypothetical protein
MSVQLLYIGIGGLIIALLCQVADENDRFFSSEITQIPLVNILTSAGIGCIGENTYSYSYLVFKI